MEGRGGVGAFVIAFSFLNELSRVYVEGRRGLRLDLSGEGGGGGEFRG